MYQHSCHVIVTEKCQRQVELRAIIPDCTLDINMVAELGWAKGHVAGPNHPQNRH